MSTILPNPDDPGFAEKLGAALLRRGLPMEYGPAALGALRDLAAYEEERTECED